MADEQAPPKSHATPPFPTMADEQARPKSPATASFPTMVDEQARPESHATAPFPTFLDNDPFPSSTPDYGRPGSSDSRLTTATSDFGGDQDHQSANERISAIPSVTGPVGEPGLPPSRPSGVGAGAVGSARPGARSSKRGLMAFAQSQRASLRGIQGGRVGRPSSQGGGVGRPSSQGGGVGQSSRPPSPRSKTHVPSLTPPAFFRPMSSQKLQAQRSQQPASALTKAPMQLPRRSEDSETRPHRYSNASLTTLRDGRIMEDAGVPPLPSSRGTAFYSDGDATPERITVESERSGQSGLPLNSRQSPEMLKLESNGLPAHQPPQKSPRSPRSARNSLRAGFGRRASKRTSQLSTAGRHEKLRSEPTSPQDGDLEKALPARPIPGSLGRNYEYSASHHLFFLRGRLLNTRAKPLSAATFLLTLLPCALFFAFSAPWLWTHVSPALPLIFAYTAFLTLSSFLHASFSDPGILPRALHPLPPNPAEADPLAPGPPLTQWVLVKTHSPATAMEVPTKYCTACALWRPPRAHHCRLCDACIETQDHHCLWLNNCVGRRNYRHFFAYIALASLLALQLLAFSAAHVALYTHRSRLPFLHGARAQERGAFALALYAVLALPYPASLLAYHLFLMARGETTREYLNSHKFSPKDRHRPFALSGLARNWSSVLCRPRGRGYMAFASPYREGDLTLGHTQRRAERVGELRGRYSVQGPGRGGAEEKGGVEMRRLPSPPLGPRGDVAKGQVGLLSNSTPR